MIDLSPMKASTWMPDAASCDGAARVWRLGEFDRATPGRWPGDHARRQRLDHRHRRPDARRRHRLAQRQARPGLRQRAVASRSSPPTRSCARPAPPSMRICTGPSAAVARTSAWSRHSSIGCIRSVRCSPAPWSRRGARPADVGVLRRAGADAAPTSSASTPGSAAPRTARRCSASRVAWLGDLDTGERVLKPLRSLEQPIADGIAAHALRRPAVRRRRRVPVRAGATTGRAAFYDDSGPRRSTCCCTSSRHVSLGLQQDRAPADARGGSRGCRRRQRPSHDRHDHRCRCSAQWEHAADDETNIRLDARIPRADGAAPGACGVRERPRRRRGRPRAGGVRRQLRASQPRSRRGMARKLLPGRTEQSTRHVLIAAQTLEPRFCPRPHA